MSSAAVVRQKPWVRAARFGHLLWRSFENHQGMLRASALSFDTTLGLVPLLALVFVGLKLAGIQSLLGPFLMQQLTGSVSGAGSKVLTYISTVKVRSLGFWGLGGILLTLFMLLENVRDAFNAIWETKEQRSLMRRGVDYLVLICAVPLLLTVAFSMTSLLQSRWLVHWLMSRTSLSEGLLLFLRLTPFLCSSLVLLLVYLLLPAARVRFRSALVGGFLTGACWQAAHWAYFHFQFGVTRYNTLYGALALVPFLLIWIYTSWLLVLLGFELVRYHQQGCLAETTPPPLQECRSYEDAA